MGHRLRLQGGTRRLVAALLALMVTVFVDSSSALSLEFLELGSSSANLTGSLSRGDEVNSDPISLPNGFPFSNETESVVFVNVNGYLSFRTARDYTSPPEDISVYTHVVAPYWNDYDITEQGDVLYEVHTNGSQLDAVNSAISQEVGVAFEGVWLLLVYWNNVPTAADSSKRDSYQGVLVTDGTKSYCLFLYHCDLLESSGAAIGFSSSGNFFFNHQLSLSPSSSEVACGNTPDSNWNSLLYQVHYDGVRPIILTNPEGPVFRAAQYIDLRCKVVTPGNYQFIWEAYCSDELIFQSAEFSDISNVVSLSSTPDFCVDVVVCRATDDAGTTAEDRFYSGNITGVGLSNRIGTISNNTGIEANSAHALGSVLCHSASSQPNIGRWISPSGEEIPFLGNHIFQVQFHTATFHSYTSITLKEGVQFSSDDEGVYSCIIPDENGEEQILHFGLYDYGYTSGFPPHPLSVRQISKNPFTLSCDSTHLPPYVVQWWAEPATDSLSLTSSHLTHRHTSSYSNTLVVANGDSIVGSTYTCVVRMQVQPYYTQTETPRSIVSHMYLSYATVQEVGGQWGISCSPPASLESSVTALTWETVEGVELARSTTSPPVAFSYTAAVRDSDHHRGLVCFNWIGEQMVYALYVTLLVQGIDVPGDPLTVDIRSEPSSPVAGKPFQLHCTASKTTTLLTNQTTASWSHDTSSDVISEGEPMHGSELSTSRDLYFSELRTSHVGDYWCEGELVSVADDTPLVVRQKYSLQLTIPMATVELAPPPEVSPGSALTLTCVAILPDSVDTEVTGVVSWETPGGKVHQHTQRITLFMDHTSGSHTHQFSLFVSSFSTTQDEGEYSCTVEFSSSSSSSPFLRSSSSTSNTISLSGSQSSSSSMATPKTTPTPEHPTVTTAGVKGRDTTGGVVGAIVVIVVVVIVVVVVAILVTYFSIRRKANQQIYNVGSRYTEEPLYELPPSPFTSAPTSSSSLLTTHTHLHDDHQLYSVVGSGDGLHSVVPNGFASHPPPLPLRTSTIDPDISPYADSRTLDQKLILPYADSTTVPDSNQKPTNPDPSTTDDMCRDSGSYSMELDLNGNADEGQSSHRLDTANPLYASTEDLDQNYTKISVSGESSQ